MKPKRIRLFLVAGGCLLLGIIILANLKKQGAKVKVQTEKVMRGPITATVSGAAKIQPVVQVKISAKVSGQIVRLGVKEGDPVKKGQFLVQLDQEGYRAAVEQARSNLSFAQAGYAKAEAEYRRLQKLHEGHLASESELELARSNYEQAKATVEQAEAGLRQAVDNLEKTTLYAPMDGTVSQLNKKVGEMAMGSQFTLDVIMVVADLSQMQAEAEIDENDVIHVSVGDSAKITIDAFPDTSFKGVVTEIANTGTTMGAGTQEEVTNFLVKVAMVEKPKKLRPGMSATADIITETRENVLKVPIQCVTLRKPLAEPENRSVQKTHTGNRSDTTRSEEKPVRVVFRLDGGKAQQVSVRTGISSETEWEILEGLEEGWEVVSGPYRILSQQLKHGDAVTVDNAQKKASR